MTCTAMADAPAVPDFKDLTIMDYFGFSDVVDIKFFNFLNCSLFSKTYTLKFLEFTNSRSYAIYYFFY